MSQGCLRPVSKGCVRSGWKQDMDCASDSHSSVTQGIETVCLYEIIDPIPIFKIATKTPS